MKNLLETLAELEHEQWVEWSKHISEKVSDDVKNRWKPLWIPYSDLSEEMKEKDRKFARRVIKALKEFKS